MHRVALVRIFIFLSAPTDIFHLPWWGFLHSTSNEKCNAGLFYLYLNIFEHIFESLLAIRMFSSFHTCSQYFKKYDSLKNMWFHSKFHGATAAASVLLLQHRFNIPRSVLNPALHLNLNAMNEVDWQQYLWFGHGDIGKLIVALQLLVVIITPSHTDQVLVEEGLCLVLHFLSYQCHWFDLQNQFGRHINALSRMFTMSCIW